MKKLTIVLAILATVSNILGRNVLDDSNVLDVKPGSIDSSNHAESSEETDKSNHSVTKENLQAIERILSIIDGKPKILSLLKIFALSEDGIFLEFHKMLKSETQEYSSDLFDEIFKEKTREKRLVLLPPENKTPQENNKENKKREIETLRKLLIKIPLVRDITPEKIVKILPPKKQNPFEILVEDTIEDTSDFSEFLSGFNKKKLSTKNQENLQSSEEVIIPCYHNVILEYLNCIEETVARSGNKLTKSATKVCSDRSVRLYEYCKDDYEKHSSLNLHVNSDSDFSSVEPSDLDNDFEFIDPCERSDYCGSAAMYHMYVCLAQNSDIATNNVGYIPYNLFVARSIGYIDDDEYNLMRNLVDWERLPRLPVPTGCMTYAINVYNLCYAGLPLEKYQGRGDKHNNERGTYKFKSDLEDTDKTVKMVNKLVDSYLEFINDAAETDIKNTEDEQFINIEDDDDVFDSESPGIEPDDELDISTVVIVNTYIESLLKFERDTNIAIQSSLWIRNLTYPNISSSEQNRFGDKRDFKSETQNVFRLLENYMELVKDAEGTENINFQKRGFDLHEAIDSSPNKDIATTTKYLLNFYGLSDAFSNAEDASLAEKDEFDVKENYKSQVVADTEIPSVDTKQNNFRSAESDDYHKSDPQIIEMDNANMGKVYVVILPSKSLESPVITVNNASETIYQGISFSEYVNFTVSDGSSKKEPRLVTGDKAKAHRQYADDLIKSLQLDKVLDKDNNRRSAILISNYVESLIKIEIENSHEIFQNITVFSLFTYTPQSFSKNYFFDTEDFNEEEDVVIDYEAPEEL